MANPQYQGKRTRTLFFGLSLWEPPTDWPTLIFYIQFTTYMWITNFIVRVPAGLCYMSNILRNLNIWYSKEKHVRLVGRSLSWMDKTPQINLENLVLLSRHLSEMTKQGKSIFALFTTFKRRKFHFPCSTTSEEPLYGKPSISGKTNKSLIFWFKPVGTTDRLD